MTKRHSNAGHMRVVDGPLETPPDAPPVPDRTELTGWVVTTVSWFREDGERYPSFVPLSRFYGTMLAAEAERLSTRDIYPQAGVSRVRLVFDESDPLQVEELNRFRALFAGDLREMSS